MMHRVMGIRRSNGRLSCGAWIGNTTCSLAMSPSRAKGTGG